MWIEDLKRKQEYSFLDTEPLKSNLILLCVFGSNAYGTSTPESDLDIRGVRMPTESELYGLKDKESDTYTDSNTDTTIYTFHRFVRLCCKANPNIIEILGVRDSDVIYETEFGRLLRYVRTMFLSKDSVYHSFSGYAKHELRQLKGKIRYPVGIDYHRLSKQMMHIIRLLKSCYDILKTGDVKTYRGDDIDLLMKIRSGLYLDDSGNVHDGYWKLVESCLHNIDTAYSESNLPDSVDMKSIDEFLIKNTKKWR